MNFIKTNLISPYFEIKNTKLECSGKDNMSALIIPKFSFHLLPKIKWFYTKFSSIYDSWNLFWNTVLPRFNLKNTVY